MRVRIKPFSFRKLAVRSLAALCMLAVALLSAFASMRLAIHGREVEVPSLAGLSDADAAAAAKKLGLNLSVENRFFSAAVAPNHVLSQSPAAGAQVRRGWQVRVTESLGGQHVAVPDLTGQSERPASLVLRRQQLELGATAHLPAPSPAGIVLAQSPPANTQDLTGPRVTLLVSDDASLAAAAYVMPQIVGLSIAAANARLGTVGLHISSAVDPAAAPPPTPPAAAESTPPPDPAIAPIVHPEAAPAPPAAAAPQAPAPVPYTAIISSQSPPPGHRVSRADAIRVTVAHPQDAETAAPAPQP